MPGLDGTGPWGEGPMTGGGRGYCNPAPGGYGVAYGWGYGRGRGFRRDFASGFGRGWGYGRAFRWRGFYPPWGGWYGPAYGDPYTMDTSEEINMLKAEADAVKQDLDAIYRRIEELEKPSSD